MRERLSRVVRLAVALAAIAGGAAFIGAPADAIDLWPYPHSCYAGCCDRCQGGLCCFQQPPLPGPGDQPVPDVPAL